MIITVCVFLALVTHEAGHALVAWVTGLSPRLIRIGAGPIVCRARVKGMTFVVGLIPLEGYVLTLPRAPNRRFAWALFLIARRSCQFGRNGPVGRPSPVLSKGWGEPWLARRSTGCRRIRQSSPGTTENPRSATRDGRIAPLAPLFSRDQDPFDRVYRAFFKMPGARHSGAANSFRSVREVIFQINRFARPGNATWECREALDVLNPLLRCGNLPPAPSTVKRPYRGAATNIMRFWLWPMLVSARAPTNPCATMRRCISSAV